MKYKAIITTRKGEQITLDLNCREYHANKLNYVFSRTLDKSVYCGAEVVEGFNTIPAKIEKKEPAIIENTQEQIEEQKKEISEFWARFCADKEYIEKFHKNGGSSLEFEKAADHNFYKILDLLGISVDDFEKELNEKNSRIYIVEYVKTEKVKRIYIYFKDCYYRLIDENMVKLLKEKLEQRGII